MLIEVSGFSTSASRSAALIHQVQADMRALAEPLPCETPYSKRRAASRVLLRLWRGRPVSLADAPGRLKPGELRARLFRSATGRSDAAGAVLGEVATALASTPEALLGGLFADLPG